MSWIVIRTFVLLICFASFLCTSRLHAQSWRCLYLQEYANDGNFSRGCEDTPVFTSDLIVCDTVLDTYRGYYFPDEDPSNIYPSGSWTGTDHSPAGNTHMLLTGVIGGTNGVKAWGQKILVTNGSMYSFSAFCLNPDTSGLYGNPEIYLLARIGSIVDTLSVSQVNGNGIWQFTEGIFTAGGADSVSFEIHINGAGSGWIYTGIDDISIREVNTGFTNPQILSLDSISQPGYVILKASPGFASYHWFNNLDSSYTTVDSTLQVVGSEELLYFYLVATDENGCRGTSQVEMLINTRNVPRCNNNCYGSIPMFYETFPNHEACNSQAGFGFGSDHTFCGQTINGSNCTAYTHTQQLNPPIPGGLFYVVNNAGNVRNTWNRADASTPSDALMIGDPWDPGATQTWYVDINLVIDSVYCFSALVSNVLENQETGYLPVASIRVSDDAGNNFPWPSSYISLGSAVTLPYSTGWRSLQGSFQATVSGMHRITIVNNATVNSNTQGDGRDLGIDEIRMVRMQYQPPTANISSHQTICAGSTAILSFTLGGNSGPWDISYSDGVNTYTVTGITSSPYIINVSPGQTTTYTLISVTTGNCIIQTPGSIVVTVRPVANASISPDQTICIGNTTALSINLTGSGPWDISYSDGTNTFTVTGITASPYVIPVPPGQTSTYILNYVIMNGCTTQVNMSSTITVIPYPSGSMSSAQTICQGLGSDLTVNLSGVGPWEISYNDGVSNIVITGITSSPYLINVTPNNSSTYTLNYVSTSGCTTQIGNSTVIDPIMNVDISMPNSATICENSSYPVSFTMTGNGPWDLEYSDGTTTSLVTGVTSSPYVFYVTPSHTTVYTLNYVVMGVCTTQVHQSVVITTAPIPTGTISGNQTICAGSSTQFSFTLNGSGSSYIQYTDGTNTYGTGGLSPIIVPVSPTQTTTYNIYGIGANGCNAGANLNMVITVISGDANISSSQTVCTGSTANLSINLGTGSPGPWDISYSDGTNTTVVTGLTASPYVFTVTALHTTTYTLNTVITAGCTSHVNRTAVISIYEPGATISPPLQSICPGSSANIQINLTGIQPWDITYSDGTNTIQVTGISTSPYILTVTPTHHTTYTLTTVTTDACSASVTLNNHALVNILPVPSGSISTNQTICKGATANISFNLGGGSAPWDISYNDGTNNTQVTGISASPYIITLNPTHTVSYTLNHVIMNGCTTQVNTGIQITVRPPNTATISSSQTICSGHSAVLSITPGGNPGPWDVEYSDGTNNHVIAGISTTPYLLTVTPGQASTTYTLNYVVAQGCTTQIMNASIIISWHPAPTATLTNNQTICQGQSAQLTFSLTGTPPWGFTWTDGTTTSAVTGISGNNYVVTVSPVNTTLYSLLSITNICSTYTQTAQALITILPLPTATFLDSSDMCQGDTFFTGFNLTGTGPWSVVYNDGTANYTITGITANPHHFILKPSDTTTYSIISITDANCTGTSTNTTFVNVAPMPYITLSGTQSICSGNTVTLTANLSGGTGPWQFVYTEGTTPHVVGPVTSSPYIWTVTPSNTTTYSIVRVQAFLCDNQNISESAVITVHPLPGATLSGTQSICVNGQAQLSVHLTGTGPWNIQYSDGTANYTITGIIASPYLLNVSPAATTQYTLSSVTDALCASNNLNSVATVSVLPIPVLSIQGDQTICAGSQAHITVNINGSNPWAFSYTDGTTSTDVTGLNASSYVLSVTPSVTTTYTVIDVTRYCLVTVSGKQAVVNVAPLPTVTLSGNQTVCPGNSTILSLNLSSGSGPWSFTYSDGTHGQTITGLTAFPWTVSVTPMANTTFTLHHITNGNGCITGQYAYAMGHHSLPVFTPHGNVSVCMNGAIPPADPVLGMNYPIAYNYLWSTGASTQTIQVNAAISTSYTVTITDPTNGCSATDVIWVLHLSPPTFSVSSTYNCLTKCYSLQASSTDPNAGTYTYNWNFTDQNFNPLNVNGASQTICYGANRGQFPYAVKATSFIGCNTILFGDLHYLDYNNLAPKGVFICPIPQTTGIGTPNFEILHDIMGFGFTWTGPNGFTSNLPNPDVTHDPSNGQFAEGIYTVAITHASGCTTSYQIGVRACCQTDPDLLVFRNMKIFPTSVPDNSTIVIDGDVTIQGRLQWKNVNVFLRPKARIIIPAPTPTQDHRLWLETCHLRSDCGDTVWYGIDVNGVLNLSGTIYHGLVVSKSSVIEDAYNAIRSLNAGFFMIQKSTLDNNYFHVHIRPFDGLNSASTFETHPGIWDDAKMLCSRPILTIPAGPGWLDPVNAINGRRTHVAIRAVNSSGLSARGISINGSYSTNFSPPLSSGNVGSIIDNADYGIDVQGVDVDVRDANFQNIYCNYTFTNPCPIPYPGFTEWPTAIRTNSNGARNHIERNRFFACTNGINVMRAVQNRILNNNFPNTPGSEALANIIWNIMVYDGPVGSTGAIQFNNIQYGRAGIQVQGNRNSIVLIGNNKIQTTRLGVVSWRNPQSRISTVNNSIDATPAISTPIPNLPWNGIHYDELGFNQAVIRANTIRAKTTGVFMTGISGPTGSQNFQVRKNNIQMTTNLVSSPTPGYGENHGIRAITLDRPILSWNTIQGPQLYSANTLTNTLRGIEVDNNPNPRVYCNVISDAKDDLVITGPNLPGEVRRNKFHSGRTAIWGRIGAGMLTQVSTPFSGGYWHSSDNEFNCPFTLSVFRADNSMFFNQARWIYDPIPTQSFDPGNSGCISTSTQLFSSNFAGPICALGVPCAIAVPSSPPILYISDFSPDFCKFSSTLARTSEEEEDDGSLEVFPVYSVSDIWVSQMHSIIDTLMDSINSPVQKYYMELNLYRYLERQDSLLLADTLLANWFSDPEREKFIKLREIETYLAEGIYDSAIWSLNGWNPTTEYELAYKSVYEITARLGTDSVNILTTSESGTLREIALNCPDTIGSPVHLARSILLVLDTFSGISECEYAALQFVDPDSLSPDSSGYPGGGILKVYPNPGDDLVTLEHLLPQADGYAFRVVNALGQEELSIDLHEGDELYEWDTSGLQQGLYYVFLYQEGFLVEYKLLSILH